MGQINSPRIDIEPNSTSLKPHFGPARRPIRALPVTKWHRRTAHAIRRIPLYAFAPVLRPSVDSVFISRARLRPATLDEVTATVTVWSYVVLAGLRSRIRSWVGKMAAQALACEEQKDPFRSTDHKVSQVSFGVEFERMKFARNAQVLPVRDFFQEGLGAFKLGEG
jgi:hypothetical protein